MKRTESPWKLRGDFFIVGGNPETTVAETVCMRPDSPQWRDNAKFIVKACNAHARLLEALREGDDLVPRIAGDDPMVPALADWLRRVRATLKEVA
jgi:hypothetical protein